MLSGSERLRTAATRAGACGDERGLVANPEKRVPGIDVLRGLCIVAVVLHHVNLRIRFSESGPGKWIGHTANLAFFWNGSYGVRVFFVISGFLIAGWSIKRWGELKKIELRQFYLLRFARIAPCLAGLLLILTALDLAGVPRFTIDPQHTTLGRAILAAATFHINWLEARTGYLPAAWDVLWSLSVEEVFYLFFPLLCTVLRRQSLLIAVLCGFIVAGPFARVHAWNEIWSDYGYLCCMDGIAIGCLAAIVAARFRFGDGVNRALLASGALMALLITVFRGTAERIGFYKVGLDDTVLEIGIALVLIALQQRFERNAASAKPAKPRWLAFAAWPSGVLRWFGRDSYEVYLTHMFAVWPMAIAFRGFGLSTNLEAPWFLGTAAIAGVLGYCVARYYSEPLNRALRVRFMPERAKRATDGA